MADTTKQVLSAIATTSGRLSDLTIKNGQLIFVQDRQKIALDFGGKRKFYNQIEVLETELKRQEISNPVSGLFYFVINTAVLWAYQDGWIQITTPPKDILFIGTSLPELGAENVLYVDKTAKSISVWDENSHAYFVVADKTEIISNEEIDSLFKQSI